MRRRNIRSGFRLGAAAMEFAVISPMFFLLLAGIIEFGQAFHIEHMLSNASRRGCRAAVVEGASSSQVEQMVKTHCARTLGVSEEDITVIIGVSGSAGADLSQAETGAEITVTVAVPFSKAGVGFYASMLSKSTLSSTCTLERE